MANKNAKIDMILKGNLEYDVKATKPKSIKEIIIAIPMPLGVGRVWLDLSFGVSMVFKYFSMGMLYLINK